MAKETHHILALDTLIEVIRQNKDKTETIKKEMTFGEWIKYNKLKNY